MISYSFFYSLTEKASSLFKSKNSGQLKLQSLIYKQIELAIRSASALPFKSSTSFNAN